VCVRARDSRRAKGRQRRRRQQRINQRHKIRTLNPARAKREPAARLSVTNRSILVRQDFAGTRFVRARVYVRTRIIIIHTPYAYK